MIVNKKAGFMRIGITVLALLLFVPTGLLVPVNVAMATEVEGDYNYINNGDGTASLSNYSGTDTDIVLPEKIGPGELIVTTLTGGIFADKGLTSVILPSSMTTIGANSFAHNSLTNIVLPDGVVTIGFRAFEMNDLTSLVLPNSVTNLGDEAFQDNELTSLTLSTGLTSLPKNAFQGNKLTSVTIPEGITSLGSYVFASNQLTSLQLPDTLTQIGAAAFMANQLTSLAIPKKLKYIDANAFNNNLITNLTFPEDSELLEIGNRAFNSNKLSSLSLPDMVTNLGAYAFGYNAITTLELPDSLKTIEEGAIYANKLTSVIIPRSVTEIQEFAFVGNPLTRATVLNPSTTFEKDVFVYFEGGLPERLTIVGFPSSTAETYAANNLHMFGRYGQELLDLLDTATARLTYYSVGTGAGNVSQSAWDALEDAAGTAQDVADDLANVDPDPLAAAVAALGDAIDVFDATVIPWALALTLPADGTYGTGDVLTFTAAYNGQVTVDGVPVLKLKIGMSGNEQEVEARFVGDTGIQTSVLTFEYEVPIGLEDADGIEVNSAIHLPAGSGISAIGGGSAVLSFASTGDTSGILIDSQPTNVESVALDKASLEVSYAAGDSTANVTQNVGLADGGDYGTTITWSSDTPGVVATDGTVTRPSYTTGDVTVTLTATIAKGSASETKTFELTVTKLAQSDAEAVAADKASLEVSYAAGDSAANVTQAVGLSSSGSSGTTITWSSDTPGVVAADGTVTRPSYTTGDVVVTLTATIAKGSASETKTFELTVTKLAQSDAEAVAADKAALEMSYAAGDSASSVTQAVGLSLSGSSGTTVAWSSDTPGVVAADGTVTRPSYTTGDVTVTLTATIAKGSASETKTFELTVTKLAQSDAEAVAADKAALEVLYAASESATNVTQNVDLSTSGSNGTTITWSSDTSGVIATDGTVTRPSYTTGDATVTLTATIAKGSASETKTFELTVTKLAQSDAEAVAADKASLELSYAVGDSASSVTQNVDLSTSGSNGTTVTWSSDTPGVVAADGTVTRPSYTTDDATVMLTATIAKGSESATKTFELTVTKLAQSDAEAVAADKASLELSYAAGDSASSVTQNVDLSTSGSNGTTVTWSSDTPGVVAADGTVTRPSYTTGDATVTLTATIAKGSASETKTFELTVTKLAQSDAEAVAADKAALELSYAAGDSASSVTQTVGLSLSGSNGTTITWSSDKLGVVAADGTVARPSYTTGDVTVTLTATIAKGSESETKTFELTVTKLAQSDAEAVAADKTSLELSYAVGDSASSVTQNVDLSSSGSNGTTITWSSDTPGVVAADGTVTRPSYTTGDVVVTLTATIAKGSASETKTFELTVTKLAQSDAEAVAADKAALEVSYAAGDSASSVTQGVGLSSSGSNGTTITWSSDTPGVVAADGTVTRPSYTTGDATVTLTATIAKGSASETKTFELTVTKLAQSDAEAVAADKTSLEVLYAAGDSASNVTQDVGLSLSGSNGTTVTWSSDTPGVVTADGTVTRPSYTTGDVVVTLTATIAKGSASETKTFELTVTKLAQSDAEAVAADKAALEMSYAAGDSASSVTQAVGLSLSGSSGTTVAWSSDTPGVVAADGTVTRPSYTTGDVTVTLTATIAKGSASETKTFELTVTKLAQSDAEAVAADKAALEVLYAASESATNVTQNVDLSTSGSNGTTITWSSDKLGVVAADGTVTRPSYTTGDVTVTLTATIAKGSASETKTFELTVTKLAQSDAEAVAADKTSLELSYAVGDSASSVTQNVDLSSSGSNGTTITWSSDTPGVVAADGTVTRPSYTTGDVVVTLTATIAKGSASETKTFELTVTKLAQSDTEAVAADKTLLEVSYVAGDSVSSVTQNVGLPSSGSNGTTVTWSSDTPGVVAADGTVTRPSYTTGDATVTLTATIAKGSESETKTFELTVTKLAQSDAEAVAADKTSLELSYAVGDSASSVTQNVGLSTSGSNGTTITWSSDTSGVIATDGTVTRPSYTTGDATVTLTATIAKGSASETKTFELTVTKLAQSDAEAVAADKASLELSYAVGDSATNVTQNVGLSLSGSSGTTITWSSDTPGVIAADGTVTCPSYATGDVVVTLTATIAKGSASETKTFELTVTKLAQSDAEAVAADKAALEVSYVAGDSASSVTQDVGLSSSGSNGTAVTWSSDTPGVVAADGTVTRPSYTTGDVTVTLTATIAKGSESATKTFELTVTKLAQSDAEAVAADKAALEVSYAAGDSESSVTQDVGLSSSGSSGTTITWSSDKLGVIATDGTVTRPSYTTGDATVTLTATIAKGSASETKTFELTVTKLAQSDAEAVAADKASLEVSYAAGDSASNVTQAVGLSLSGSNGTTVTWSSDTPGVVAADGTVTRPSYTTGDVMVTLTATIAKGSASETKTFELTVTVTRAPSEDDSSSPAATKPFIDNNGILLDPSVIDATKPSFTLEVTPDDAGAAYVSIPASLLTVIEGKNASFIIEIKAPYGSYRIPVNLASMIPGLLDWLAGSGLKAEDVSFKITLIDKTGDKDIQAELANDLPEGKVMGAIVDFGIAIINGQTGQVIGTADSFSQALTRVIPLPMDITDMPEQWGAYRYNETEKTFEFVPANKMQIDGVWYVLIRSYSNSVYLVAENAVSFMDVAKHWSEPYVRLAAAKGLVYGVGDGKYNPDQAVTRAEFAAMLVRALGRNASEAVGSAAFYDDVKQDAWYYGEVAAAKELGLLDFVSSGSFKPDQPLTREEMARMLAVAVVLEKLPMKDERVNLDGYRDIGDVNAANLEAVRTMVKLNIMTGTSEHTFSPRGETTRAQAATVFIRMLQALGLIDG